MIYIIVIFYLIVFISIAYLVFSKERKMNTIYNSLYVLLAQIKENDKKRKFLEVSSSCLEISKSDLEHNLSMLDDILYRKVVNFLYSKYIYLLIFITFLAAEIHFSLLFRMFGIDVKLFLARNILSICVTFLLIFLCVFIYSKIKNIRENS